MSSGDIYISFGADTGPLEASFATARAEVRGLQAELNKTANTMRSTGAAADSELGQRLVETASKLSAAKGQFSELNETIKAHSAVSSAASNDVANLLARFRQLSEGLTGLHEAFSSASEVFAGAFAVHAIADWINSAQEAGEHIERLSAQLGASATQVQELGAIAKLTGTDFDQMALSLERMQLRLRESASASNPTQAALKALGIEAKSFVDLPIPEQLDRLAEAFASFADGPTKTAAAMAVLGRAGADLIPTLDRGRAGFAELERTARATGAVLANEDVRALADAKEKSAALSLAIDGLKNAFAVQLNPAITYVVESLTNMIEELGIAIKLMQIFSRIPGPFALRSTSDLTGALGSGVDLKGVGLVHDRNLGAGYGSVIKPQVPDFTTGRGAKGAGGGAGGNDDAEQARAAYQTEVDAARNAATSELDTLDNMVKQHKISWSEWAKDSVAALETEKAAIEKATQAAIASASLTSVEKQRIANDEARALAEIAKKEADDQAKAAEEIQRSWDNFFKPFNSAVDQMVSSLTSGHHTIAQDLKKTLESMLADVIKFFVNWALHQAEMVAEKLAGDRIMQASSASGDIFSLGALLSQAARAVSVDAGVAAAGVAANQAPILGPGAIAEGLGAGAVIAGLAGGIGSADIGMWEVPHDQLNLIHQGELVMPAAEAGSFRNLLSGATRGQGSGGNVAIHPTANFNVSALDGPSVASWMRSNGPAMAKALNEAARHGAALGLKRLRSS